MRRVAWQQTSSTSINGSKQHLWVGTVGGQALTWTIFPFLQVCPLLLAITGSRGQVPILQNAGNPEEPTQRHSKHGEIENCPYKAFLETGDIGSDSLYVDIPAITRMAGVIDHLKDNNGFLGNLSEWMNDLLPAFP